MKTSWGQVLAWIAASVAALLLAWATPSEDSIERGSSLPLDTLLHTAAA